MRTKTSETQPLPSSVYGREGRDAGIKLRMHGIDPAVAGTGAREAGYAVLVGGLDKPRGLRKAYILDRDGYGWVPDVWLPTG